MQQGQSLYILQAELINSKVEAEMSRAITPIMDQIALLKQEMTLFRHDMANEFSMLRKEVHTEIGTLRKEVHTEIGALRKELHTEIGAFRKEMQAEISTLRYEFGNRLTAVETALGIRRELRGQVRIRFLDYSFKAGSVIMLALLSAFFSFLSGLYFHGMLP